MRSKLIFALGVAASLGAPPAFACPGVFIRDPQSYDDRDGSGTLQTVDVIVPKGTKDEIVGYTIVGGKKYDVQLRAYLHDPADIQLQKGCVLKKYE
jgi:hypothetical protein